MMDITIKILQSLARFTWLSYSQLDRILKGLSKKAISNQIRLLREKNFVWTTKYGYHPQYWRLEDIHYLKIKGENYLKERYELDARSSTIISNPKPIYDKLRHRTMCINIQIAFHLESLNSGVNIVNYNQYFQRTKWVDSNRFRTSTKINMGDDSIIPDSILTINICQTKRILALELIRWYRVSRVERKTRKYVKALVVWSISRKYNTETNAYNLNVFENESTMRQSFERLSNDDYYTHFKKYFLFKTYNEVLNNPLMGRRNLTQQKTSLLEL